MMATFSQNWGGGNPTLQLREASFTYTLGQTSGSGDTLLGFDLTDTTHNTGSQFVVHADSYVGWAQGYAGYLTAVTLSGTGSDPFQTPTPKPSATPTLRPSLT